MPKFKLNKDDQTGKNSSPEYLRDDNLAARAPAAGHRAAKKDRAPDRKSAKRERKGDQKNTSAPASSTGSESKLKSSLQKLKAVSKHRLARRTSILIFIAVVALGFTVFFITSLIGLLKLEHVKTVLVDYHSKRLNYSLETAAARIIQTTAQEAATTNPSQDRTLSSRLNRFDANKVLRELDRTSQLQYAFDGGNTWQNRPSNGFVGITEPGGRVIAKDAPEFLDTLKVNVAETYLGHNLFLRRRVALLTRNVYGVRMKGWYKTAEKFDLQHTASGTKSNAGATNKRGRSTAGPSDSSTAGDVRLKGLDNQDLIYGISDYLANYAWLPGFVEGAADHHKLSNSRLTKGLFASADPRPAYNFMSNFKNTNGSSSAIIMNCLALNLADDYIVTLSNYRTAELMRIAYTFNSGADQQKRGDTVSAAVDQRVNDLSNAENVCDYQKAVGDRLDSDCLSIYRAEQPIRIGGLSVQDGANKVAPVKQYRKGCQFVLGALVQGEKDEAKLTAAFKDASAGAVSEQIQSSLQPEYSASQNRDEYEKLIIPSVVKTISGLAYFNDSNDRWGVYLSAGDAIIAEAHSRRSGGHDLSQAQAAELESLIANHKSTKNEHSNSKGFLFARVGQFLQLKLKQYLPGLAIARAEKSETLEFPRYGFTKDEVAEIEANPHYSPRAVASRVDGNPNKAALVGLYDKCSKLTEPELLYKPEDCAQLNNMSDGAIKDLNYSVLYDSAMDMIDSTQDSFPSSNVAITRPLP